MRLNVGIFVLHVSQMAMFVVVPPMLVEAGLALPSHWKFYLPVVLVSFVLMVPAVFYADRRNHHKPVLLGTVLLLAAAAVLGLAGCGRFDVRNFPTPEGLYQASLRQFRGVNETISSRSSVSNPNLRAAAPASVAASSRAPPAGRG